MSAIEIEVFREDVDELSDKLSALIVGETAHLNETDRSIIIAAALANAACAVDIDVLVQDDAIVMGPTEGVCRRLRRIAASWRG